MVKQVLYRHQIPKEWILHYQSKSVTVDSSQITQDEFYVRIPKGYPAEEVLLDLQNTLAGQALAGQAGRRAQGAGRQAGGPQGRRLLLWSCKDRDHPPGYQLIFGDQVLPLVRVDFEIDPTLPWEEAKIALIIDDFGYHFDDTVKGFLDLPYAVTFAVIPGLPYSQTVAEQASHRGFEIMIHLPMEPLKTERVENQGYTLFTGMSLKRIKKILEKAYRQLPQAKGLNNHMGSKVSLDRKTLGRLMEALRSLNLYYIDSQTHPRSRAYRLARKAGLRSARIDTYLDNPQSPLDLHEKMQLLVEKAKERGYAIGTGHARPETLEFLKEEMAQLAIKGIRFAPVSEVLRDQEIAEKYQALAGEVLF